MRAWIVALCLAAATAVAARPAADPAAGASKWMAKGEFEKALKRLDGAAAKVRDPKQLARIHLLRGQCQAALENSEKAQAAFALALEQDPTLELDPQTASPEMVDLFERARAKFPAEVSITTGSVEATVRIDGAPLGPAPLKTKVGAGKHTVEAVAANGQRASKEIVARPGRQEQVTLDLTPLPEPVVADAAKTDTPEKPTDLAAPPLTTPPETTATAPTAPPTAGRSQLGFVPIGVGVAAAGAGVYFMLQAGDKHRELIAVTGTPISRLREDQLVREGALDQALGLAGFGVGVAAGVAGVLMLALSGGDDSPEMSAVFLPGQAMVGVRGTLP